MQPKHFNQYRFRRPEINKNATFEFSKFLPFVVPLLIFFGVARLILYYIHFNIDIILFLDFSEILTSFFDILIFILLSASTLSLIYFLAADYHKAKRKKIKIKFKFTKLSTWDLQGIFYWIIAVFIFSLSGYICSNFSEEYFLIFMYYIFFFIPLIIIYDEKKAKKENINNFKKIAFIAIYFVFVTIVFLLITTSLDVYSIKENKKFFGVKIAYKNEKVFISDSNNYFIGNTHNYIFIHHQKENVTTAEKMDEVKSISFPKRITTTR